MTTIKDVRNVNNKVKLNNKSLGGCISQILSLDKKGIEKQEQQIIEYLVNCKKDKDTYKKLSSEVKPHHKTGNYNVYAVLLAVKRLLNK